MVYRNKKQQETTNAGRLGAGFISVCFETRWLGYFGGSDVPEPYCIYIYIYNRHLYDTIIIHNHRKFKIVEGLRLVKLQVEWSQIFLRFY